MAQKIISIVAFDNNRLIGARGKLIWHLKEDMLHFKKLTMGNICIMGRVTWESIPEQFRPLSGRKNIVVSRNPDYVLPEGAIGATSLVEALKLAADDSAMGEYAGRDIYICGGAQLYEAAMPYIDAIEVTEIAKSYPDVDLEEARYFPEIDLVSWYVSKYTKNEKDGLFFDFMTYEKVSTIENKD